MIKFKLFDKCIKNKELGIKKLDQNIKKIWPMYKTKRNQYKVIKPF